MVYSPNRALISALLPFFEYDPSRELKRQMFQDAKLYTKSKRKETSLNPMDTMFNFIYRKTTYFNYFLTSLNMGKLDNVLWMQCFVEKKFPIVPFKDMKDRFEKALCPITHWHYRLLVGSFFLIDPGDNIACLISKKNSWLNNKASKKNWMNLLKQCWETELLKLVQFQTNIYFLMAVTVSVKPYWHSLCNYFLVEHDIIQLF